MRSQVLVTILTGAAAALLLACAAIYYPNLERTAEHARWVAHTQRVLSRLDRVSAALHDAQGVQRTFLLVGGDDRPADFFAATDAARRELAAATGLTTDNPAQAANVARLRALVDEVVASWSTTLAIYQREGFDAARARVAAGTNDRRLATIDTLLDDMRDLEEGLLRTREEAAAQAYTLTLRTGALLVVLGLLSILLFGWILSRYLRERETSAELIFHQRQLLEATLNSIGDGVVVTDGTGHVTFLNDIAERLTGWSEEEARGQDIVSVFRIVGEDSREVVPNPAMQALERGTVVGLSNHTILVARDGSEWPLDDSAAPIRDAQGAVRGAVLIFREISERRARERALARSERQFHLLAESIPQLCWVADAEGCIHWFNQVWYDYTGSAPAPLRARQWAGFHHPDHVARVLRGFLGQLAAGEPWEDSFPLRRHDGEFRWFLARAAPLTEPDGQTIRWFGTCTDITATREAEQSIRASEAQLRTVLDNLPAMVAVLDLDGRLREVNRPALEIAHITREQAVGLPFVTTVWWQRSPAMHQPVGEAIARGLTGEASRFDIEINTPDAPPIQADFMLNPIRDEAGRVTQLIASAVDISARKAIEAALRVQTAKTNRLLEAGFIGVIVAQGQLLTEANDAFLAMVGVSRTEFDAEGLDWTVMTPGEHAAADARALAQLRDEGRYQPFRKEYLHRDGHRVPVLIGGALLDANSDAWISYVQDLTHVTQVERQLREADLRKDEFLATLAHELRNPLAPLANSLNLLRLGGEDGGRVEDALGSMARQVDQLTRLVDDLLDISRISRGAIELRRAPVALAAVIDSAVETSQPHITAMGHELVVDLPTETVLLDADLTRLAQVFANLLNNACKYTPQGGHIHVTARAGAAHVEVTVSDDGIGIRADHQSMIFDLFTQADSALHHAQGGLGIGLPLVRRLVEMHDGKVRVESEGEGRGARFVVELPRSEALAPVTAQAPSDAAPALAQHRLRILVVDDNRDNAESLAMLLEILGHEVSIAHDGEQAIAMALHEPPDVVLLDIGLPRLDGHAVCRRLRQTLGDAVTIVAQTGWGQEEDRARSRAAGFDHHLVKPIPLEALQRILEPLRSG
ncbi:MAG: PAS domain S-box protein [Gammaproteobacteria bacterium]|nr:PAS domain S-box protein [Gammaproteobacteria bacterium]